MELQIISFWRPSKQALLKFTKSDQWAFFEKAILNNSVDLRVASYWSLNLVSIPCIGFWGELDTEAKCYPDAQDGPCFSPLHRTGVEVSAVANKPRMAHKPPRLIQCRMYSNLDIGKWQSLAAQQWKTRLCRVTSRRIARLPCSTWDQGSGWSKGKSATCWSTRMSSQLQGMLLRGESLATAGAKC